MIIVSDILFTRAGSHCKSARSEAPKGTHKERDTTAQTFA